MIDLVVEPTDTMTTLKEKLGRFLGKSYLFKSNDKLEPFSYVEFDVMPSSNWDRLKRWIQDRLGAPQQQQPTSELVQIFGKENQSIRHSLRSYLHKDMVVFTRHVDGRCFIRVGSILDNRFYGVQTIRYDQVVDPFPVLL
ncbi:hypothetical protein GCM10028806_33240 [Spirosoma terrae]|uniref:Uncharacterized protein n=1 Tax=Spirosoma terrae TaxID=1968276 RepID=A0A6L9LB15_9BACT|nr:hypothetical protein [Spirosoma terrae]NDU95638.1 hypothetical protein [Spirosoma terrae]